MPNNNLGKINASTLQSVVQTQLGALRKNILVEPAFGVDVSVVDIGNGLGLATTSDPLSLIPILGLEKSAWLSVHLAVNDMATTGFKPQYAQFVLNLPSSMSQDDFSEYWSHIHRFCKDIDLSITGGHTGFIEGQNSTIAGGVTMSTVAPLKEILVSKNAQADNSIVVTKSCALSSAAILAGCFPQTVSDKLGKETCDRLKASFFQTTSLMEALLAKQHFSDAVFAMHDVTEGGVLGAIFEMASASELGADIDLDLMPIGADQQAICDIFELNPTECIGAGSMLMSVDKNVAQALCQHLNNNDIPATVVGHFSEQKGVRLHQSNHPTKAYQYRDEDPYWAAFFNALNKGWK